MNLESILFQLSVIIVGAGLLGTLFLYLRQPIIVAYIAIGILVGPSGLGLIPQTQHIEQIAHFGIILLLFLIGLNLQPGKLIGLFQKTALLTLGTSAIFAAASLAIGRTLGFDWASSLVLAAAMMFSSTVVSLKLIPTTTLHHRRTGEVMTSVLLIQDILAILVILLLTGERSEQVTITFVLLVCKLGVICLLSFAGVRYLMIPLLTRFDTVQEYTFLATLAWCLLWAEGAHLLGLSYETGAFVAGLSIASCKVAIVIAEYLKPLREFFLILFFFAIGSKIDLSLEPRLLLAAAGFGLALVPFKKVAFDFAFRRTGESKALSHELAVRLSQSSEFSLLVTYTALSAGLLANDSAMVIQIATIVSIIASTYWVVRQYPTPISKVNPSSKPTG